MASASAEPLLLSTSEHIVIVRQAVRRRAVEIGFSLVDQTKIVSTMDTEAYPQAGAPNPIVDLFVYDVASKQSVKIDVREGTHRGLAQ